ncbi:MULTISPECIES: hypothetical protein [Bacillus]|uniref:hypothetical protein n=1 Tax=Bacillus TaxID=1386 RepID=UPI0020D255F1|nr:hypothetical protein [Bacillus thuringiensis]MEB9442195.1 hypothetical protein [Bacillus cereus]
MDNPNKDKTCFIITPIGDDQSDTRRAADGVIDAVIVPALCEMGFDEENIKVAHRMPSPGSINKQVISSVLECDLAVANLTNLNPNVMYELAIRHAARKPVIQICQKGTRLPFDITEERTIFYTNDMAGVIELNNNFKDMVVEAICDEEPDNPIYRVVESNSIMKNVDETDPSRYMLNRIDSLEKNLSDLIGTLSINKSYSNIGNVQIRKKARSHQIPIKIDERKMDMDKFANIINEFPGTYAGTEDSCQVNFEFDGSDVGFVNVITTRSNRDLARVRSYLRSFEGVYILSVEEQKVLPIS